MPVPETHIQERLSVAYVSAVIARAGYAFWPPPGTEYGTDGLIQRVYYRNGRYRGSSDGVFVQIKASVDCAFVGEHVHYEMDVEAFNSLAEKFEEEDEEEKPIILIVFAMPRDRSLWLQNDDDTLLLRSCCYWKHIVERPSRNRRSFTIRIPRAQRFNVEAVEHIYRTYRKAALPGVR